MNNYYSLAYEITPFTMAVIAQYGKSAEYGACILETQEEFCVKTSPTKLIDHACKSFGASLKGRQDGTRDICNITHKAPIAIDPTSGMYFFPTISPLNAKCSWIAHSYIDQMRIVDSTHTEVLFKNGKSITVDVSYGSMLNQTQRTAQFRYLLDNRIKYLRRQGPDMVAEPYA
ncbi:competence protein [Virgibacillus phasianinus]|uniref:Competence protein n=1 Tax=Virgibacillus phasianinus TaxID=2017483 RepID=A0A220TYF0_9BACI|nr:competence protein ComK [Virgibacillus phasianinus]ASK60842.1 competence protein [Virgibacillus phasianinus]